MQIPLNGMTAELLFAAVIVVVVLGFLVELSLELALHEWMQERNPRPERPRFPWTDRTGT